MTTAHKEANPAPLGLLGFGMTTILLNLHNAGFFPLSVVVIAMGLAMGGLAQIIAGLMEFRAGNTFGATAFTSYGAFWWSLVIIWVNPWAESYPTDAHYMGWYLLLWGVYTLFMFVGTLKQSVLNRVVFGTLTVLFFLLAAGDFTGNHTITIVAGIVGIVCGAAAMCNAMSQVLSEVYAAPNTATHETH